MKPKINSTTTDWQCTCGHVNVSFDHEPRVYKKVACQKCQEVFSLQVLASVINKEKT